MPITVLEIAERKGAIVSDEGVINASEFNRLGLPMFGGCQRCQASIAAYNAFPSKTGYLQCRDCIGDIGFETAAEFDRWMEEQYPEIDQEG